MKKDVTSRLLVPVNLIRELTNARYSKLITILNFFKGFCCCLHNPFHYPLPVLEKGWPDSLDICNTVIE